MRKVGLDESPVGIKIAGRNINNLRYADDTTLMAESEELKSLLMRVKEESAKVGLKLNIKKTKIMASGPITSWQIDGEEMELQKARNPETAKLEGDMKKSRSVLAVTADEVSTDVGVALPRSVWVFTLR
ncbi:putative uncharacterized transposon-derived protein F52C9.6 [Varanus komodoensis]|nr:putative uncharacterized transposon-derived protein F52C9.6 [Varanus komodoensis]